MTTLFQYPPCWNLPNASPFCMKVETFLRMNNLPYETAIQTDPRKSPKKKLPYIDDNGQLIADSSVIISYLTKKHGLCLDNKLSCEQKALALSLQRLIEEHLYWIVVYSRWLEPSGWQITKSAYFSSLPAALKRLVPWLVRRNTLKALYGQGISRHTREEVYALGIADLGVIQQRLATQPFLLGETASSIDACAYAFIANILYAPIKNPLQDYTRQHTCFELYCQRMHDLYFL